MFKEIPTRPSVDENVLKEFASILPFRDKETLAIVDAGEEGRKQLEIVF